MIIITVGCVVTIVVLGVLLVLFSLQDKEPGQCLFGITIFLFGVLGMYGLYDWDNNQYIPAEPIAYNSNQTVFTTNKGNIVANGIYPDGEYMLDMNDNDVLVVWQAIEGGEGLG